MAILRPEEIRDMSEGEIYEKMHDLQSELMKLMTEARGRGEAGVMPEEETGKPKEIRKTIARMKTILHERNELK